MREGTLRVEARLDADSPMPEARAMRQVFVTLVPRVERQLREACQHILRGIEAKATR